MEVLCCLSMATPGERCFPDLPHICASEGGLPSSVCIVHLEPRTFQWVSLAWGSTVCTQCGTTPEVSPSQCLVYARNLSVPPYSFSLYPKYFHLLNGMGSLNSRLATFVHVLTVALMLRTCSSWHTCGTPTSIGLMPLQGYWRCWRPEGHCLTVRR